MAVGACAQDQEVRVAQPDGDVRDHHARASSRSANQAGRTPTAHSSRALISPEILVEQALEHQDGDEGRHGVGQEKSSVR